MRVLFVHQNFPGQYKHLAPALARRPGHEVLALTINECPPIPGVRVIRYAPKRGTTPGIHPWAAETETKVVRGEAAATTALALRAEGFRPDVICAHPGWGEALFLKDVWPDARMLAFIEFHYAAHGFDVGFDPEYPLTGLDEAARLRMKNTVNLLSLDMCDWGLSPTLFQRSTVPAPYRDKVSVIHDGVDTGILQPNPDIRITLNEKGLTLSPQDEVITFVNRSLEPYRGYHTFMRALPEIQRRRPLANVLIIGGDGVSYGSAPKDGISYRQKYLTEVGSSLDLSRIHFLGNVPYGTFISVLQLSSVHVYLTYPFVLSWSMLEAMSVGSLVVGSATPPVMEVIEDGVNGLLVDFFSPGQIADAVDRVLDHPDRMREIRDRARRTIVERYDTATVCLPRHLSLVDAVAQGIRPPDFGERAST
jgi:glycosyltransferase involved in cell wall biosynthesis